MRTPSEVLSGEDRSMCPSLTAWPNSRSPTSSEKLLSKKFTSFHSMSEPTGLIQYWSERLSPRDLDKSADGDSIPSDSSRFRSPLRDAGIERERHQSDRLSDSRQPLTTVPNGMWSLFSTALTLYMSQ